MASLLDEGRTPAPLGRGVSGIAPVEIMTATREQLLRLPGIGPKGTEAIMRARHQGRLTELGHLRKLNIHAPEQAAPYILLDGHRPAVQIGLFERNEN